MTTEIGSRANGKGVTPLFDSLHFIQTDPPPEAFERPPPKPVGIQAGGPQAHVLLT